MGRILLLLLMLNVVSVVYANFDGKLLSKEVARLDSLEGKELISEVIFLFDTLERLSDQSSKIELTNRIFNITQEKNELAHVISLVYKVRYSDTSDPSIYDSAFEIAMENNNMDLMMLVEERRSRYYIDKGQYDKAVIYLINLLEMTSASNDDEAYRNTLNLLADIYFNAGLYDQARSEYLKLLQFYFDDNRLNYWRTYVIMNDLGQIEIENNNLTEAMVWFGKSLYTADSNLFMPCRNNTIAYTRLKIAEIHMKMGEMDNALQQINEVEAIPIKNIYEDVQQEYHFTVATFFLANKQYNLALKHAGVLMPSDTSKFMVHRFVPEVYKLVSEIYSKKNEDALAMSYLKKYTLIADSLKKQSNIARSMILLAESNNKKTRTDLNNERKFSGSLIFGIVFLSVVLLTILLFYRRLYISKLKLVKKSVDKTYEDKILPLKASIRESIRIDHLPDEEEIKKQLDLIIRLNDLFIEEKAFLNPGLNIKETAEMLSTNRTYLSKAINTQLNSTFPAFVNEYRIKESINQIVSGFTLNHTIEALAKKSGFASRNVFVAAFKKNTGVVPSFFIANYKKLDGGKDITEV